jgi:hypothetical protein
MIFGVCIFRPLSLSIRKAGLSYNPPYCDLWNYLRLIPFLVTKGDFDTIKDGWLTDNVSQCLYHRMARLGLTCHFQVIAWWEEYDITLSSLLFATPSHRLQIPRT